MSSLEDVSELEQRILVHIRAQNLDPYNVAPERHASMDESGNRSDKSDLHDRPPSLPQAVHLENANHTRPTQHRLWSATIGYSVFFLRVGAFVTLYRRRQSADGR